MKSAEPSDAMTCAILNYYDIVFYIISQRRRTHTIAMRTVAVLFLGLGGTRSLRFGTGSLGTVRFGNGRDEKSRKPWPVRSLVLARSYFEVVMKVWHLFFFYRVAVPPPSAQRDLSNGDRMPESEEMGVAEKFVGNFEPTPKEIW